MEFVYENFNVNYVVLLFFIILMLFVFILMFFFSKKKRLIRFLKKIPNGSITNLKLGKLSKIKGEVLNVDVPLISPITNQSCVFYSLKIQTKKRRGKNNYWNTVVNVEEIQNFLIKKDGDLLIVKLDQKTKNYSTLIAGNQKKIIGNFKDFDVSIRDRLNKYHSNTMSIRGNMKLRYIETIIKIGNEVTVAGIAEYKNLQEPIKGYSYTKVASLESGTNQKIIITDLPNLKTKIGR